MNEKLTPAEIREGVIIFKHAAQTQMKLDNNAPLVVAINPPLAIHMAEGWLENEKLHMALAQANAELVNRQRVEASLALAFERLKFVVDQPGLHKQEDLEAILKDAQEASYKWNDLLDPLKAHTGKRDYKDDPVRNLKPL